MPAINVQSTIEIAASASTIMSVISDFRTWPAWSPWLYTEPDATVNYVGNAGDGGHGYDWRGNKVGAGAMQLLSCDKYNMRCDLSFLKPFKSQANVALELHEHSQDSTTVVWSMDSKLPFFMFFFKDMMIGMIRSDYKRGLSMLKDYIETDAVPSSAAIAGVVDAQAQHYVGYPGETSMDELPAAMGQRFETLMETAQASTIDISGSALCFYNKMDIKKGRCSFTAALPVDAEQSIPEPMVSRMRPACKALKVIHTGAYRHLGSAWATIMGEARAKKLKVNRKIAPFECYVNDPQNTDEKDLITEVYLPLR